MLHELAFVFVAEAGNLEQKAALLLESIRRYGGKRGHSPVWIVQPRSGPRLSPRALEVFHQYDAVFVNAPLNKTWRELAYANKVYAAAFVESLLAHQVDTLVFLGSDMIVLQDPEEMVLRGNETVGVRPVDGIRTLAQPATQELSDYWRMHLEISGADLEQLWNVETTVGQHAIRAYFQGDMLAVRPSRGIFRCWRENMERLACDARVKRIDPASLEYCMMEQVCFAATVLAQVPLDGVKILDWRYNYPLPLHSTLPAERRARALEEVVLLHYHREFEGLEWMQKIAVHEPVRSWLLKWLPQCAP